ncbi:MAG: hypothetical protein M0R46_06745 [Candidatus Muirbacterium halophilum]|nr:hypothetical protein [Candidatus Muirbacterium halophilum]
MKYILEYKEFENKEIFNIGDMTTLGEVEDVYTNTKINQTQYLINGQWYHEKLVKKGNPDDDTLIQTEISNRTRDTYDKSVKNVILYHGTDEKSAENIKKTKKFSIGEGITFFTKSKKEAKEYAKNKSLYRGGNGIGEVFTFIIPNWCVNKNKATGEYETDLEFDYVDDKLIPTKDSILRAIKNK